jgi:hypothetical protein
MDLYDEFGNYIGPELDDESGSDLGSDFGEDAEQGEGEQGDGEQGDGEEGMDVVEYGSGVQPADDEANGEQRGKRQRSKDAKRRRGEEAKRR